MLKLVLLCVDGVQGEGEFDCLAGITVNGLGQIIIADRYNHRIQIFDRGGNFQRAFGSEGVSDGELNYPWGVACDNMGFIYVCDKENHRIQVHFCLPVCVCVITLTPSPHPSKMLAVLILTLLINNAVLLVPSSGCLFNFS
jgi:hypothetical protein